MQFSIITMKKWLRILLKLRIEPLTLVFILGYGLFQISAGSGIYFKLCSDRYGSDSEVNCHNLNAWPKIQDELQKSATWWDLYISIAGIVSGSVSQVVWSALGDSSGRKLNMLISLAGIIVYSLIYVLVLNSTFCPIWTIPIFSFVLGFTGRLGLFVPSLMQYLADTVPNKAYLTFRYAIISGCTALGAILYGLIGSLLLKYINLGQLSAVGLGILTLSFFYILIFLEPYTAPCQQDPPITQLAPGLIGDSSVPISDPATKSASQHHTTAAAKLSKSIKSTYYLLKSGMMVFLRKRPGVGRDRAYLILTWLVFFLMVTDEDSFSKQTIFMYHRPLTFTPAKVSVFGSVNGAMGIVGSIGAVILLQNGLGWSDTALVLFSLSSLFFRMVVLAATRYNWMIWLSVVVGMSHKLFESALQAFLVQVVGNQDTGKVLAGLGLANNLSSIVGVLVFDYMYIATEAWYAGFVFAFSAGLGLVAFWLMLWVHVDFHYLAKRRTSQPEWGGATDNNEKGVVGNEKGVRQEVVTEECNYRF